MSELNVQIYQSMNNRVCRSAYLRHIYIYIYGKMMNLTEQVKEFVWQKYGKVKNLYGNVKDL